MDSFFTRYRNFLVLFALLLAQIVGLAVQVRHTADGHGVLDPKDGPGVRLIRYWAESIVAQPEGLIHSTKLGLGNLWQGYIDLHNVRQQNLDLQRTVDRLRLEQASLMEDARQGQRLQAMLGFQQKYIYSALPAQVIGSSGSDQSRVFYIDKGSADGLKPDMAVVTADGIVGKIRDVFPHTSQVLAANDQTAGAGVILEKTRTRGVLRGDSTGRLEITGIVADQRIQPGEKVLTAGGDLVFPRGLAVGEVQKVVPDPDRDSHILVYLKPAAHLDGLDEVLIITSTESRFSNTQNQDMATSETMQAPELTVLNEQKKASEIMAERLPGLTDPNLPAPKPLQPGETAPKPVAPARPPLPTHPDRYSPSAPVSFKPVPTATPADAKPGSKSSTQKPGTSNGTHAATSGTASRTSSTATHQAPASNGRN